MHSSAEVVIALIAAFAVTLLLVPAIEGPAQRLGLMDHPDYRKRHKRPTPLTGGLGIFAGFIIGMLVFGIAFTPYWTLIVGMVVLLIVGLVDDLVEISAKARFLIQIGVACLMVYGGGMEVRVLGEIFGPAYGPVGLGFFAGPFTVACVVFMINAINMTDGLDGLAGGIGMIMFLLMALAGWLDGAPGELISIGLLMALATAGFLVHNIRIPGREQARAFLGDTGSMVLGYSIAWLAVALGTREGGGIYPITIALLLIVPGVDTVSLFLRRIHLGRSPFSADRTHLHHIIRRCGYSCAATVHIIHLAIIGTGLAGILAWQYGWAEWALFVFAAGGMVGYQILLANAHRIMRWHHRRRRFLRIRAEREARESG